MTLIVEDGSIVTNANTYVSEADANLILADFALPALNALTAESSLKQAAQYLQSFDFKGRTVSQTQSLAFPRSGIFIDCFEFPFDEIPSQLIKAQVLAANLVESGVSLYSNSSGQEIISKTVDVISVTYAASGVAASQPIFGAIQSQLKPLLAAIGQLRVSRS